MAEGKFASCQLCLYRNEKDNCVQFCARSFGAKKNFCMSELKHVACGVDCELAANHDLRQLLKLLLPEHLRPVSKGWATRLHGTHWDRWYGWSKNEQVQTEQG